MRFARIPTLALVAILGGCTSLRPSYERPALPVSSQWAGHTSPTKPGQASATEIPWTTFIADPTLHRLIRGALENNRDLRLAALAVEKARAQYDIRRSDVLPSVDLSAYETIQRTPASLSSSGSTVVAHDYATSVGISAYELDLFERVRSLRDDALQQYLATDEARRSAHLSLVATISVTYLNWAANAERMLLAEATLRSRQSSYDLQRQLFQVGRATQLGVRQAEGELEAARGQVLVAKEALATDRNALELLVGHPLAADLRPAESVDGVLAAQELPAGLPSDLLSQRPDILAAEHRLIGANANIGAARAAFFPSVTLTGGAGLASDGLSDLFRGSSFAWSFVPRISLPIFTGGRLRAGLEVAEVERDLAVAEYERSIQSAFREVSDGLVLRGSLNERRRVAQRQVDAAAEAFEMVERRYRAGVATYLEVLDAQRTLLASQQSLISIRLSRQTNLVTLYKALGGGWTVSDGVADVRLGNDSG
ncbi:efflux transporter outer membrane subunit [Pseudomonas fluorescens]|uniref:efflux transporter outer membrane subunit n=1 Tax=Pseudomonas fluorescens TaxID=294 RepID=UPI0017861281|nr:efflux transporter outer membrane subunit [Pseudomonas fluorescens]